MSGTVDTAKVTNRRQLHFSSIEEVFPEIDRIVAAENDGSLRESGNWTAGQIMGHLAAWINYSYDGFPCHKPPWLIRMILRRMLKRYLRKGMPCGQRMRGVPDGTYGTEPLSTLEGSERLRRALKRLQSSEPARFESPGFGKMSHEQRIQLNLRHAELHLGFLAYK
jgi:hypothetical protein